MSIKASGDNHEWGCLMLNFPEDFSAQVVAWGKKNVPADVLYNDEEDPTGYGLEKQIHTTVVYGLDPKVTPEELNDILGMYVNIPVTIGKLSKFENKGKYDVLKFDVIGDELHKAHQAIKDALPTPGETFPDFKPHQTVAYVLPGSCDHLLGEAPFEGQSFILKQFDYSRPPAPGKKDKHTVFQVEDLRASAGVVHGLTLGPVIFAYEAAPKFWISPEGEFMEFPGDQEHIDHLPDDDEDTVWTMESTQRAGWTRGGYSSFAITVDANDAAQVEFALSHIPQEKRFVDVVNVLLDGKLEQVPVQEGEDALDAWKHRKDVRHRVVASRTSYSITAYHGTSVAGPDSLFEDIDVPGQEHYVTDNEASADYYTTWKDSYPQGYQVVFRGQLTLGAPMFVDAFKEVVDYGGEEQGLGEFMAEVNGEDEVAPGYISVLDSQSDITAFASDAGCDGVVFVQGFSGVGGADIAVFDPESFKEESVKILLSPDTEHGEWSEYMSFAEARKRMETMTSVWKHMESSLRPIIFADEAFQLRKAAIASIENDPKYTNYRNDPKIASELGALQQALNEARDEGAIQEAWLKFKPTTPFESLKSNA